VPIRQELGAIALVGADWRRRADWAMQMGIQGADLDPELLQRLDVEITDAIPATDVRAFLSNARFSPIFHRPLFNELGLVTNRTFETFLADTLPLVMLPKPLAEAIYGSAVRPLLPKDDIADWLRDITREPEQYCVAVGEVRQHLAAHHSY